MGIILNYKRFFQFIPYPWIKYETAINDLAFHFNHCTLTEKSAWLVLVGCVLGIYLTKSRKKPIKWAVAVFIQEAAEAGNFNRKPKKPDFRGIPGYSIRSGLP